MSASQFLLFVTVVDDLDMADIADIAVVDDPVDDLVDAVVDADDAVCLILIAAVRAMDSGCDYLENRGGYAPCFLACFQTYRSLTLCVVY